MLGKLQASHLVWQRGEASPLERAAVEESVCGLRIFTEGPNPVPALSFLFFLLV